MVVRGIEDGPCKRLSLHPVSHVSGWERERKLSILFAVAKKGLYIYMDGGEKKDFHALLAAAKMSWMGWSEIKGGDK